MEKGTKILIGAGCGCLGLPGLVVVAAAGVWFLTVSREPVQMDLPIPGMEQLEALPTTIGEPRDDALASYVNGMSTAVLASARGLPVDPAWSGRIGAPDPTAASQLLSLGASPTLVMTVVELEATNGTTRIRSMVAVFPDGRVRWAKVTRDTIPTEPTPGLVVAAPAMAHAATRMLETLAGACDLPTLTAADVSMVPTEPRQDILRDVSEIPRACNPGVSILGFQPKVDDVSLLVQGAGQLAMIRTDIEIVGGVVRLDGPDVRLNP